MDVQAVNVVIGGEAGQGLVTVGQLLAKSLVRSGFEILVSQSYMSRIRGGHNTFTIRCGVGPILAPREGVDLLIALDRETIAIHAQELAPGASTIVDVALFEGVEISCASCLKVPFNDISKPRYHNVVALGAAGALLGLDRTPASTASLLLNFEAVATALIAILFFRESVGRRILWAVGLITVASILLTWNGGNWGFSLGALAIVGACFLWGLDNNLTRHISGKDPLMIVGVKGIGAGLFSLLIVFILKAPMPSFGFILIGMMVGVICYGLSIQLFILALRGLGSARTGTLFGIAPFVGAALSIIFLKEIPQTFFWVAVPVMILGAWLMLSEDHAHQHTHDPLEHAHAHSHPDEHHEHGHEGATRAISGQHTHLHHHQPVMHSHPHSPDLHHRHDHSNKMG